MTGCPEEAALQQSLKAGRGRKRKGIAGSSENSNELLIIGSA